ncbi:surfeit locus 1 family protein [Cognatiyoonia koreensis]|uniref:SURF1-like protein n=1 Tax=Cognatiyoonia koreensis TaxID=364200 RepID=A0A1I0MPK5_9RHOB|nr:SURF1 family protein [Cognatiyoonia koreensis]SEV90080.1 surfeit locus 1 family protein [Cognatiyoonia koreensis]
MRNIIFPLILGIGGCAILLYLGIWQLQRLEWKETILADIDARLAADPVALPLSVSRANDNYRGVYVVGRPTGEELHVLVSGTEAGTGFRTISKFEMQSGGAILVDLGLLPLDAKDAAPRTDLTEIAGNLIWPDDKNSSTPAPDIAANTWFARDVIAMSQALDTLPIMVVANTSTAQDPRLTPLPINSASIKNDHWEYAITWFLLAIVWAAMTIYLIFRTRQKDAT